MQCVLIINKIYDANVNLFISEKRLSLFSVVIFHIILTQYCKNRFEPQKIKFLDHNNNIDF